VIAEHDNAALKDATQQGADRRAAMGGDVHVLVAGKGCQGRGRSRRQARRRRQGAAGRRALANALAEPLAALIVSLAGTGYDAIVAPATTDGKNIMPRVAALLDVMQISDISRSSPDTFERPIYAGNAIQTVQSSDAKKVITVRTAAFEAAPARAASAADRNVAAAADPASRASSRPRSSPSPTVRN
jgi:electron transfer flavoprotein alpha subunit